MTILVCLCEIIEKEYILIPAKVKHSFCGNLIKFERVHVVTRGYIMYNMSEACCTTYQEYDAFNMFN